MRLSWPDFLNEKLDRVSREGITVLIDARHGAALSNIEEDLRGDSEEGVEDAEMAVLWGGGIASPWRRLRVEI